MNKKFVEPEWDAQYVKVLDALIDYLDKIGERENPSINQHDITIIKALIEFYDFDVHDNQDIIDIMDDVKVRADQLEIDNKNL